MNTTPFQAFKTRVRGMCNDDQTGHVVQNLSFSQIKPNHEGYIVSAKLRNTEFYLPYSTEPLKTRLLSCREALANDPLNLAAINDLCGVQVPPEQRVCRIFIWLEKHLPTDEDNCYLAGLSHDVNEWVGEYRGMLPDQVRSDLESLATSAAGGDESGVREVLVPIKHFLSVGKSRSLVLDMANHWLEGLRDRLAVDDFDGIATDVKEFQRTLVPLLPKEAQESIASLAKATALVDRHRAAAAARQTHLTIEKALSALAKDPTRKLDV